MILFWIFLLIGIAGGYGEGLTAEEVDWLLLGGDEPDRTKEKSEAEMVGEIILNALKGVRV